MDGSLRVLDVQEKEVGAVRAPAFPTPAAAGFPQPKKRTRFASAFKQQRQAEAAAAGSAGVAAAPSPGNAQERPGDTRKMTVSATDDEKASIDRENRELLSNLNPDQIAQERQELLANLDPSLLQILLRRANLDENANALPVDEPAPPPVAPPEIRIDDTTKSRGKDERAAASAEDSEAATKPKKSVLFASVEEDADKHDAAGRISSPSTKNSPSPLDDDAAPLPTKLAPISSPETVLSGGGGDATSKGDTHAHEQDGGHDHQHDHEHDHGAGAVHFPQPPAVPDLDPADPDFLSHLHAKYFPNLPADPARLAWMAPLPTADSPADRESPYYPGQATLAVSQLRFDFRGRLVPPSRSRAIPVSKGLHHHGLAPEAAGYTIEELAILARSAVAAQRCVAFQTLGRILYRLGRGEWGAAEVDDVTSDPRAALAQGIWRSLSEGRVLDTLREAAGVEEGRGHRGSRAYAIEALWLFEKGGWKERWKGR